MTAATVSASTARARYQNRVSKPAPPPPAASPARRNATAEGGSGTRRCGLRNACPQQPQGLNLSYRAGAPRSLRCPPQGGYGGAVPSRAGGCRGVVPPRLVQQAISCEPTESSERACSSAFTSSLK